MSSFLTKTISDIQTSLFSVVNSVVPTSGIAAGIEQNTTYLNFRTNILNTPDYKNLNETDKENKLRANLKGWINTTLGPLKDGPRTKPYLENEMNNEVLFEIVKLFAANKASILTNLANLGKMDPQQITAAINNSKNINDFNRTFVTNLLQDVGEQSVKKEAATKGFDVFNFMKGGNDDDMDEYYVKYIKYKAKYLKLKSKLY